MSLNYIYLIQEREFFVSNQNVYKIGKTKQDNMKRLKDYPKGSNLILYIKCKDCDKIEIQLINDFIKKYKHRRDIGNEYFECDVNQITYDIFNCIHSQNILTTDNITNVVNLNIPEKPDVIDFTKINNYGKENLNYLTFDKLYDYMGKSSDLPFLLMKEIHFNPDYPENHNIRKIGSKFKIKEEYGWISYNIKKLAEELFMKSIKVMTEFIIKELYYKIDISEYQFYMNFYTDYRRKEPKEKYTIQINKIISFLENNTCC